MSGDGPQHDTPRRQPRKRLPGYAVARLLDPENDRVQLDTIQKAAAVVGKRLAITLEDLPRSAA